MLAIVDVADAVIVAATSKAASRASMASGPEQAPCASVRRARRRLIVL
jgi:hypothetical protein